MIFKSHGLSQNLSNYIESIFHFKGFMPDHSIERVVPTGHIFLLFELDGIVRHTYDNETLQPNAEFQHVWVSGMHKNYISISAHENSEMFVIQFKPAGAHPFIHRPIEELNDTVTGAESVFGDDVFQFRKKLLNACDSDKKFELAEAWLMKRFDETKVAPTALIDLLKKLQTDVVGNHQSVIETYPRTQKHLIDQFKKYIGLTPKYYHRILRFNDILQQINHQQNMTWADVALTCGYSDQSHFIKEFQHFSGFNPSEYISNEYQNDEANFFALDKDSEEG